MAKKYRPFFRHDLGNLGVSGLSGAEIFGEDNMAMPGEKIGFIPIDELPSSSLGSLLFGLTPEEQLILCEGGNVDML